MDEVCESGGRSKPPIIQFVSGHDSSSPATARSHAARIAHARKRQARTLEYQATTRFQQQPQQQHMQLHSPGHGQNVTTELLALSAPLGLVSRLPPSRVGSGRSDPFRSFARQFTPLENFLFDHYIAHIVPRMKAQCRGLKARGVLYADAMTQDWVRLALNSPECLNSLFLNAARHLSVSHQHAPQQRRFAHLADSYKLLCVRAVSDAITTSGAAGGRRAFSDTVLAETLALAYDEVSQDFLGMMRRQANRIAASCCKETWT